MKHESWVDIVVGRSIFRYLSFNSYILILDPKSIINNDILH